MKKILSLIIISLLMSSMAFGANQWREGTGVNTVVGTVNASDIDTYTYENMTAPIDRVLSNYRENCAIYYVSTTSIGVRAGEVVCSNAAGTIRKFRKNTSVTTEDIQAEVSGAGIHYVFAVADADATTFTIEVDATTTPSATCYKLLGEFYASADNVVANDDGLNNYNNYYALKLGDWVSRSG